MFLPVACWRFVLDVELPALCTREVESTVVTRLLQTHCLPSHADMPAMTVHIGLTDMLTIVGSAVRCLFQFKQLN